MSTSIKKSKRLRGSSLLGLDRRSPMLDMLSQEMMKQMMVLEWAWKLTLMRKMRTKMRMKMKKLVKTKTVKVTWMMTNRTWKGKRIWTTLSNKLSTSLQRMVKQNNR